MIWPDGKRFAFTVFDDTDAATLANIEPVYALLENLGIRVTKSVWLLPGSHPNPTAGATCEDGPYREWLLQLQDRGFEIGYHMASWDTSDRSKTIRALSEFESTFGGPPSTMANHSRCEENMYWGAARLDGIRRTIYNLATRGRNQDRFRGHVEGASTFWGDLCREKITYVRGYTYPGINTLADCPQMPYHDPNRPFVNRWFASSDGPDVESYNRLLCEANQDRLEAESGACIVYTHFGVGFCDNGQVNKRFESLMKRLAKKDGWFVPVGRLLDHLEEYRGTCDIAPKELARLQWKWLLYKLRTGRK